MNISKNLPDSFSSLSFKEVSNNKIRYSSSREPTLIQKVAKIVLILFKTLVSLFLYWTNPSIFALGFIIGIVFDDQCKKGVEKIKNVWGSQPWSMCIIGTAATALSLPVTLGAGSFLWGAYLGASISKQTHRMLQIKSRAELRVVQTEIAPTESSPLYSHKK
jgi:hypothetical protein